MEQFNSHMKRNRVTYLSMLLTLISIGTSIITFSYNECIKVPLNNAPLTAFYNASIVQSINCNDITIVSKVFSVLMILTGLITGLFERFNVQNATKLKLQFDQLTQQFAPPDSIMPNNEPVTTLSSDTVYPEPILITPKPNN